MSETTLNHFLEQRATKFSPFSFPLDITALTDAFTAAADELPGMPQIEPSLRQLPVTGPFGTLQKGGRTERGFHRVGLSPPEICSVVIQNQAQLGVVPSVPVGVPRRVLDDRTAHAEAGLVLCQK